MSGSREHSPLSVSRGLGFPSPPRLGDTGNSSRLVQETAKEEGFAILGQKNNTSVAT